MRVYPNQTGFSLLELILVIVLLGILASGAGLLITTPIKAYNDQLRRTQLVDQAEMALRQIARDIRGALPNSIRTKKESGVTALEMVNIVAGARYRDEAGGTFTAPFHTLDFNQADTDFNFLGTLVSGVEDIPLGQRLVIYNTAPTNFYEAANSNDDFGIVTPANSILTLLQFGNEQHLNIDPPFEFQDSDRSPGQRSFLIDGPVSYICDPLPLGQGEMTRYTNYPFLSIQPTEDEDFSGLSGTVATQLTACSITYDAGEAQRNGVVTLSITLSDDTDEGVTLLHQVHVVNVP
jgi:MSHA biogenesis protein MshO